MEETLNDLFLRIRENIFFLIKEKNVDIDILAFDLGIDREDFLESINSRTNDFTFYLQTLSLLENWEV